MPDLREALSCDAMRTLLLVLALAGPSFIYEDPAADQAIRHASTATYALDLVEARRTSGSLRRTYPDHPVGYLLEAETYWWEAQIDPTRGEIEDQYFKAQEKTIEIGDRALKAAKYLKVNNVVVK